MNIIKQIIVLCLPIFCVALTACDNKQDVNDNNEGNDYVITTQAQANKFDVVDNIRTLTVTGKDVTDISMMKFKNIKNLVVDNSGIVELKLPNLNAVTVSVKIINNKVLKSINGFGNLMFLNGVFTIDNNDVLEDISSLRYFKVYKGNMVITNNPIFGKDVEDPQDYSYGLFPIKYLADMGVLRGTVTLRNNHAGAATSVDEIGQAGLGDVRSYSLTSQESFDLFKPKSSVVRNLTISGSFVTSTMLAGLTSKITEIQGTLTIEDTKLQTTVGFFNAVKCTGDIIFRNNGYLENLDGFKDWTHIYGDFIIEDSPYCDVQGYAAAPPYVGLGNVVTIDGSLKIKNARVYNWSFPSLVTVGGDFEIRQGDGLYHPWGGFYNFGDAGFAEVIGGDLLISDCPNFGQFTFFDAITTIGGNVTITHNKFTSDDGQWCVFKALMTNGVIKPTATVTISDNAGVPVDLNKISCK